VGKVSTDFEVNVLIRQEYVLAQCRRKRFGTSVVVAGYAGLAVVERGVERAKVRKKVKKRRARKNFLLRAGRVGEDEHGLRVKGKLRAGSFFAQWPDCSLGGLC
jgi:hypothetical protein